MTKLKLVHKDEPILTNPVKFTTADHVDFPSHYELLIRDMKAFASRFNALGLAANQVGYNEPIIIIRDEDFVDPISGTDMCRILERWHVFVNPVIKWQSPELTMEKEACLSLPGIEPWKIRNKTVKFDYNKWDIYNSRESRGNRVYNAEFTDSKARILQHEIDHLNGILITDKTELEQKLILDMDWNPC